MWLINNIASTYMDWLGLNDLFFLVCGIAPIHLGLLKWYVLWIWNMRTGVGGLNVPRSYVFVGRIMTYNTQTGDYRDKKR